MFLCQKNGRSISSLFVHHFNFRIDITINNEMSCWISCKSKVNIVVSRTIISVTHSNDHVSFGFRYDCFILLSKQKTKKSENTKEFKFHRCYVLLIIHPTLDYTMPSYYFFFLFFEIHSNLYSLFDYYEFLCSHIYVSHLFYHLRRPKTF